MRGPIFCKDKPTVATMKVINSLWFKEPDNQPESSDSKWLLVNKVDFKNKFYWEQKFNYSS